MSDITIERKKKERRYVLCVVAMVAVCLAVAVVELSVGALQIDPVASVLALFGIGAPLRTSTRFNRSGCRARRAPSSQAPVWRLPAPRCKACWKTRWLPLPRWAFLRARPSVRRWPS